MKGKLPAAQDLFQEANRLSRNSSALRELAAIALARNDLITAESLARDALSYANTNPFLVDLLLAVLIKKVEHRGSLGEIDDLFRKLESVGEENGRSFYTSRKAEFEYLWGDIKKAITLIEEAAAKTPTIFEVRRLQAIIHLKDENKTKAAEIIEVIKKMVDDRSTFERRTNFRAYLETKAEFLQSSGKFNEAKLLYNDEDLFSPEERIQAIRNIEIAQAYQKNRP